MFKTTRYRRYDIVRIRHLFLCMALIMGLIGTLLSVNFLPVPINPEDLTQQQIDYFIQEGTINYEFGKKLQFFALVFFVVYMYFLVKNLYTFIKNRIKQNANKD